MRPVLISMPLTTKPKRQGDKVTRRQGDGGRPAAPLSPCLLVALSLLLVLPAGAARAALRDLQAHGSVDHLWVARVEPRAGSAPGERTTLFVRAKYEPAWTRLEPVGSRVLGLASRGSQLAILLSNGDWLLMTDTGPASGRPLPPGAHMIALGSDANSLWAVGLRVRGGDGSEGALLPGPNVTTAPATGPATRAAAPDPASTEPETTTRPAAPATAPSRPGLTLYRLGPRGWEEHGPLPPAIPAAEGVAVSLAVVDGRPVVAHKAGDRQVRVFRRANVGGWEDVAEVETPVDLQDFKLMAAPAPVLWLRGVSGPDRLWIPAAGGGGGGAAGEAALVELGPRGRDGQAEQAVAVANGSLRLVWVEDDKVFDQRLDVDGQPVGDATSAPLPAVSMVPPIQPWAHVVLMSALLFAMAASIRHRREMGELEQDPARLPLAQHATRLAAGAIDVVPAVVTAWLTYAQTDSGLAAVGAGAGVYLVLTTAVELAAGRSIGKLATGLRVVGLDGKPATVGARVVRNVLRVIDLPVMPLALILFSPLRQRAGDLAAGTLVVRGETEQAGEADDENRKQNDESMTKPE